MDACFAELIKTRSYQTSVESIGMEEAQGNHSHQDESRGVDVHLGIEGTKSNGHGEERNENMNMDDTINNLQKDVQSHKVDNERVMRAKEQKDEFNMKLLEGLNIIEKKLIKESGLRKSRSHKPLDEKENQENRQQLKSIPC
jgi:hypothetical protein